MIDPNQPEFRAFVKAMREQPGDDTTRLVFVDWLDERGHSAYATFVRAMLAVDRMDPGNRLTLRGWEFPEERAFPGLGPYYTAHQALKRTWATWEPVPGLGPLALLWRWHRGTIDELAIDWQTWGRWWPTLLAFGPVGEVTLTKRPMITVGEGIREVGVRLATWVAGREHRSQEAVVVADARVWGEAQGDLRWRLRDNAIEQLLGQVWDRSEVDRFHVNDNALSDLTP